MTTGERIRKRREELGLTQTDLALRMGYKSRAAICNVEKDKEDLTTTRIRKFAEALETTPAYLMGWQEIGEELKRQTKPLTDFFDNYEIKPEYKELFAKYTPKEIRRAAQFAEAFLRATPEQQKIALEILQLHQEDA